MPRAIDRNPSRRVSMAPPLSLCLDYANTRFWHGLARPTESLADFNALPRWLDEDHAVDAGTASRTRALRADAAQALFDEAPRARGLMP